MLAKKAAHNIDVEMLQKKYGPPILYSPSTGKVSKLNPRFIAEYLSSVLWIKYSVKDQSFMEYRPEHGIWTPLCGNKIHENIWDEVNESLRPEPGWKLLISLINSSLVSTVVKLLKAITRHNEAEVLTINERHFHAANCMVVFDMEVGTWEARSFSPEFYSRDRSRIVYDPSKDCPRFLNELIRFAMDEDDIEILQLYLGQCLLSTNLSQMFLLLEGMPGGGKSTLVNIIEKMIGKEHCTELRPEHASGRFEIASLYGKKLLTGKDVSSQFMCHSGGRALKFLTGNDMVTGEFKNSNTRVNIEGNFNIIITSNNTLRMKFDGDLEAWRRRILIIKYENAPPKKKIANFDDVLFKKEGSGILNWIMEGATKLVRNGSVIPKNAKQKARVDQFLKSSDPLAYFADLYIHPTNGASITSEDVLKYFTQFCHQNNWDLPPDHNVKQRLKSYMADRHGASTSHSIKRDGKSKRGYRNFQIRQQTGKE